jgi:hypothetical protein
MTEWQKKKMDRYDAALLEARRFVFKAEAARVEITENEYSNVRQAAAKRASMDLTRALADLRRNLYQ